MKTAGMPLLALVLAGSSLAAEDPAAPATRTSARLAFEIRATLPKFAPPPPPPADFSGRDPRESDPSVLALPKVTVKEYRPRDHDPDVWLGGRALQQKAMAAYRQSMNDLEWALNSWHIPLVTPRASVRARSAYQASQARAELLRVHDVVGKVALLSPEDSAELKQELVNLVLGRPPGAGK